MKWLLLILASLALSCRTPERGLSALVTPKFTDIPKPEEKAAYERLRTQASQFDQFLKGNLPLEELYSITEQCEKEPTTNIFCYSIPKVDEFEDRIKEMKTTPRRGRRIRRVYPKFKGDKVVNWKALREASVSATIRPVAALNKRHMRLLKAKIESESQCPMNVAVSVAAALEDKLPKQDNTADIAALYKQGGRCMTPGTEDYTAILTRAGLFSFLRREYAQAIESLILASATPTFSASRARYWLYRTQFALKKKTAATKTLESLKADYPFAFHSIVAQAQADGDAGGAIPEEVSTTVKRSEKNPSVNILIQQAEILFHFHFEPSALLVVEWALLEAKEAEPEIKIHLARLRRDDPDQLTTLSLLSGVLLKHPRLVSRRTLELYFPTALLSLFKEYSVGIDPLLLIGVARQESAFNPKARSTANALGLLQIRPQTGRRISRIRGRQLYDPKINIEVGSKYLQQLIKNSDGKLYFALSSYNAGPRKTRQWRKRYPTTDPMLFIDLIPYRETRDYVGLVLRNYYWYRRLLRKRPISAVGIFGENALLSTVQKPN